MKRYDNILFDLDGPILDGKMRHYNCYRDIIHEMKGKAVDIDYYWAAKRSGNNRKIIENESGLNGKYKEFMIEWINRIEEREYLKYDILKPDIVQSLDNFRKITRCLILVTMRNNKENLMWQLKKLDISGKFDKIIVCNSHRKDSKFNGIKNLSLGNSLLIGDTEIDIETANMAGVEFIGIANGLRTEKIFGNNVYYQEVKDIFNLEK